MSIIPSSCKNCQYAFTIQRKYGKTTHCDIEPTKMDVTHVKGRSSLCPLLRQIKGGVEDGRN
jgi:hypothetical protein